MKPQLVPSSPQAPDMDALLAALQEAMAQPTGTGDPGYTTDELMTLLKWPKGRVNRWLTELHRQGRLISGRRLGIARDGRACSFVVYRVKDGK